MWQDPLSKSSCIYMCTYWMVLRVCHMINGSVKNTVEDKLSQSEAALNLVFSASLKRLA